MAEKNVNDGDGVIQENTGTDRHIYPRFFTFEDLVFKTTASKKELNKLIDTDYTYSEAYSGTMFPLADIFFSNSPSESVYKVLTYVEQSNPYEQVYSFFNIHRSHMIRWLDGKLNSGIAKNFLHQLDEKFPSDKHAGNINLEDYLKERAVLEKNILDTNDSKAHKARCMKVTTAILFNDIFNAITHIHKNEPRKKDNLPQLYTLCTILLAKFAGDNAVMDGIKIQKGRRNQKKVKVDKKSLLALKKKFIQPNTKQSNTDLWLAVKRSLVKKNIKIGKYIYSFRSDPTEEKATDGYIIQTDSEGREYSFSFEVFRNVK